MSSGENNIDAFRELFRSSGDWFTGEDDDPYSIVFVVRDRVNTGSAPIIPPEEDVISAAIAAMVVLFSHVEEPDIRSRVELWCSARIRKIVKRAHGSKWEKAYALIGADIPGEVAECGDAAVACFVPMKASEQPPEIRKLQVSGLDLARDLDRVDQPLPYLSIVLEQDLDMSSGKAIAQACHAAQLAFRYLEDAGDQTWKASGFKTSVSRGDVKSAVEEHACPVIVRDAGFTEIPAGSVTAAAYLVC